MTQVSFMEEIKNAPENEYFYPKDLELIEKMRMRARLEADQNQMGKILAVADKQVLRELQKMGFNRKTVRLLYFVPLIQVAWSEGMITGFELRKIIEIARLDKRLRKAQFEQLLNWINNKPTDDFFTASLKIIRIMLESLDDAEKAESKKDLISYCTAVARASGGLLGLGNRISDIEKNQIEKIAGALGKSNEKELSKI